MAIDETERLKTLRDYLVMNTLPEEVFNDVVRLASGICETPIALISLVDDQKQWFKARIGLDTAETPREQAFCAHAILYPSDVMEVSDATKDPRFRSNPLVTGDPNIRFYAGAPLVAPNGQALGTVCVIDRVPRKLDYRQFKLLSALARQVMAILEMQKRIRDLEAERQKMS